MLKSMTGFGNSVCDFPEKKVTVEIKSLNSKQLDVYSKLPSEYNSHEQEVRNILNQRIVRGKVFLNVIRENNGERQSGLLNHKLAKSYADEIRLLSEELGLSKDQDILSLVFRMPEVLNGGEQEANEEQWIQLKAAIEMAINQLDEFRLREGLQIRNEVESRIRIILSSLDEIVVMEPERVKAIRERILRELFKSIEEDKIDKNRLEQEMIYYIEKIDINEEKSRLEKHCDYFLETLNDAESGGKKLAFICQEIGREVNTLGSKANHAGIQRIIVRMKDELEKVKEQLMNVL
jgi:uncharacterized protein (TIGR00255 family)